MPNYIFADPNQLGKASIFYRSMKRGEKWWYQRTVKITHPNAPDEFYNQWFGGYDSIRECDERMAQAQKADQIPS